MTQEEEIENLVKITSGLLEVIKILNTEVETLKEKGLFLERYLLKPL